MQGSATVAATLSCHYSHKPLDGIPGNASPDTRYPDLMFGRLDIQNSAEGRSDVLPLRRRPRANRAEMILSRSRSFVGPGGLLWMTVRTSA